MSKYGHYEAGNDHHHAPMPGLNMFCLLIGATNMSARPSGVRPGLLADRLGTVVGRPRALCPALAAASCLPAGVNNACDSWSMLSNTGLTALLMSRALL